MLLDIFTRKWISNKDKMRDDIAEYTAQSQVSTPHMQTLRPLCVYGPAAWLQTKIQHHTLLKMTLVTKQIINKTSQKCAKSKLTQTYSECAK